MVWMVQNAASSTTNSTWTGLGANPGIHDECLATNGLALEFQFYTNVGYSVLSFLALVACHGNIDKVNTSKLIFSTPLKDTFLLSIFTTEISSRAYNESGKEIARHIIEPLMNRCPPVEKHWLCWFG
jgi:hypothetical protein